MALQYIQDPKTLHNFFENNILVDDKVEFKKKNYEKLLYHKILTNRLELLACINIVLFILPVVFYKFHRFSEHFNRANSGWIRCLQTYVRYFNTVLLVFKIGIKIIVLNYFHPNTKGNKNGSM